MGSDHHMTELRESGVFVHPTAVVSPAARLGIGAVIGPGVTVASGAVIGAYSVIGGTPEHRAFFADDPEEPGSLSVVVEEGVRVFEFVTVHAGTRRATTLCRGAAVFNHSHIAHDCHIGPDAVVGGQASLAGHTTLFRGATVSGKSCTHQFSVLGAYSFLGAMSYLRGHISPGQKWLGNPARLAGLNEVGLERADLNNFTVHSMFDEEFERAIKEAK